MVQHLRWLLLLFGPAIPLLGGCDLVPDYNAPALATLHPAALCNARLPYFGHYAYPQSHGATLEFVPASGSIVMSNDGGWCAIRHEFVYNDRVRTFPMSVMQSPAHGRVVLGAIGGKLWLAYQPVPGFIGPDFFRVRLYSGTLEEVPVHVTVQP